MTSLMQVIRNWFGAPPPEAVETLPPTNAPLRTVTHKTAMAQSLEQSISDTVVLHEYFTVNGKPTEVEVRADRYILKNKETHESKLVRLTDSLEHYQAMEFELRLQLGRRIARLMPELAHSKHELLLNHTAQVLRTIARDQDEKVRSMLAEELAELPDAPIEVIRQLAWDNSAKVACPILEFSPLLADRELLEIIATSSLPGVAEAIARREQVSQPVSSAIVATGQPEAIGFLLENKGATIDETSMNAIIDLAPEHEIWHESLAHRSELTRHTMARLSGFVAQDILIQLEASGQIARPTKSDARAAVSHRLHSWSEEQFREAERKVRRMHSAGKLDNDFIDQAIHATDKALVTAALAERAGMRREKVKKLLSSGSARAITSLAWQAGLPMRSAYAIQMKIGNVHHAKLLHPRGGSDYPLPEEEMQTYLDVFH